MEFNEQQELISFINHELGTNFLFLEDNAELERDLKLAGDDIVDFIISFAKKFNVDISDLDLSKYSYGEGLMLNFSLLFKKVKGEAIPKITPLTIKDLKNAIVSRKLI